MGSEGLSQSSLLYRLMDRLPVRTALLVAVQHVLAMFVGVITVPLLVAQSLKLPPNETGLETLGDVTALPYCRMSLSKARFIGAACKAP
jgi:hypothetical protein